MTTNCEVAVFFPRIKKVRGGRTKVRDCEATKTACVSETAQAPAKISLPIVTLTADCSATIAKNKLLNA